MVYRSLSWAIWHSLLIFVCWPTRYSVVFQSPKELYLSYLSVWFWLVSCPWQDIVTQRRWYCGDDILLTTMSPQWQIAHDCTGRHKNYLYEIRRWARYQLPRLWWLNRKEHMSIFSAARPLVLNKQIVYSGVKGISANHNLEFHETSRSSFF